MRHKGQGDEFYNLIFVSVLFSLFQLSSSSSSNCGGIQTNVDKGEISAPFSYLDPLICTWILTPPPGRKLLINVQQVTLPSETDQLYISIDKHQIAISRHCQLCWSNLEAQELNVTYISNPNTYTTLEEDTEYENENQNISSEINYTSSVSFHVSYQSFDPLSCSLPKNVDNGYFFEKNRTIGSNLKFVCRDPYEVIGNSRSTCVVSDDSKVPKWDPPLDVQCLIPECNGKILNKSANRNVGLIVHPGFPAKMVLSGQHCTWMIKASNGRRIHLNLISFSLPTKQRKKGLSMSSYMDVFDGNKKNLMVRLKSEEESRNLTSKSNLMILELKTANISLKVNDAAGEFGFQIEYFATCNSVPTIQQGSVLFADDVSVGSVVVFQCDVGFDLIGSSSITCLPDLSWSNSIPICHPSNDTLTTSKISTAKKQNEGFNGINQQDTNPKDGGKNDGGAKGNKQKPIDLLPNDIDRSTEGIKSRNEDDDFTLLIIVLAVVVPVVVLLFIALGCFLWYRKQYPVRMGLGRKFETFENPAYERKRNKTANSDDPAELQKLTSLPSP